MPAGKCSARYASRSWPAPPTCSRNRAPSRRCPVLPSGGSVNIFENRAAAGRELAARLHHLADRDVVVLALPRGGVPVAYPVAEALGAPLDVFVVRKLGTPGHRELAMGAIASGGVRVLNDEVVKWYGIPAAAIDAVARDEEQELRRR